MEELGRRRTVPLDLLYLVCREFALAQLDIDLIP